MNNTIYKKELLRYLSGFVTEQRKEKIACVLSHRSRTLAIVLENISNPRNASAVLRTSECLGIQDIHIVDDKNPYDVNPYVTRGSAKWIAPHQYNHHNQQNIKGCFKKLKIDGYQIIATTPNSYAQRYTALGLKFFRKNFTKIDEHN